MVREIDPKDTTRAYAFDTWMKAPIPMVTFLKTIDVSRLVKISNNYGFKFNMLMCWCIGKAASEVKEFYMLPVDGKLEATGSFKVGTGTKAVVAVSKAGKAVASVRFVLK